MSDFVAAVVTAILRHAGDELEQSGYSPQVRCTTRAALQRFLDDLRTRETKHPAIGELESFIRELDDPEGNDA